MLVFLYMNIHEHKCMTASTCTVVMKAPRGITLGACVSVVHCQLETINMIVHCSNLSRKLCALS